jgi:hypothetical protein
MFKAGLGVAADDASSVKPWTDRASAGRSVDGRLVSMDARAEERFVDIEQQPKYAKPGSSSSSMISRRLPPSWPSGDSSQRAGALLERRPQVAYGEPDGNEFWVQCCLSVSGVPELLSWPRRAGRV